MPRVRVELDPLGSRNQSQHIATEEALHAVRLRQHQQRQSIALDMHGTTVHLCRDIPVRHRTRKTALLSVNPYRGRERALRQQRQLCL